MELVEDMSMEDLAMKGGAMERKAAKVEKKRLRHLENVKKDLNVDEVCNEDPLEASEVEESLLKMLKGFKDPLVRAYLLGIKVYKQSVNNLIEVISSIAKVREKEVLEHLAAMLESGLITPETTVAELFALEGHEKKVGNS